MTDDGDGWRIGGRYVVAERLGSGGMAEVFRARDEVLGRDVAIKVFRTPTSEDDTATRVERRQTELDALAKLNHPNLITLYDAELSAQPAYLVMELIEGTTLAERISDGPLAERACREIGRQLSDALAYVHARGMAHRDVKPANILLGTDGRARLSDFGIVRLLDQESMTRADATLGSASYLAPEQMHGSQVGPPADVYALGLTLIEALSGTRSFDGPPLEAAMARLARDPVIPANVAGPWPRLLAAMTARDPHARPSAEQVTRALRTAGGAPAGLPADAPAGAAIVALSTVAAASTTMLPPVPPAPPPAYPAGHPAAPPPERHGARQIPGWALAAAAVVIVLLIAAIAAALISSDSDDSPQTGSSTGVSTPATTTGSTAASTPSAANTPSAAQSTPPVTDSDLPTGQLSEGSSPPPSSSGEPSSTPPSSPSTSDNSSSSGSSSSSSSGASSTTPAP